MPRPQRIEYEGACYHVMNRGRNRQRLFHSNAYRQAFLDTLAEAHQRFGAQIHAYCLMDNHYHLLIETPRGNLSRIMRHINGLYTQRHNRLKRTDGPLFRGRFKAILVDSDNYLLRLSRYIHRNPIDTHRPRVRQLAEYPWSSYPAYINKARALQWLVREPTYRMLGYRQRYVQYQRYVEQRKDEDIDIFYRRAHLAPILGSEAFIDCASRWKWHNVTPQALYRQLYTPPDVDQILAAVCRVFAVNKTTVLSGQRGERRPARWVAMYVCQTRGSLPLSGIAKQFGLQHVSGVSHQIKRLKEEAAMDPNLDKKLKLVIHKLTPLTPN